MLRFRMVSTAGSRSGNAYATEKGGRKLFPLTFS